MIMITRHLSVSRRQGSLPLRLSLRFSALSDDGDAVRDVVFQLPDGVAFQETGSNTRRMNARTFTPIARSYSMTTELIGNGDAGGVCTIMVFIVGPGADPAANPEAVEARTAGVVILD